MDSLGETPLNHERVLVTPAARLHELGYFTGLTENVERYLPALLNPRYLSFRLRSEMEVDPTWLQLIPYLVLRHAGRIFQYTRGRAGGEKRLHALKSIGIGGHINPTDLNESDPYRAGMNRELHEEVKLESTFSERIIGLVHDPSTPVGQVHLGVVHVLTLENPKVSPREAAIATCGFTEVEELRGQIEAFETWSQFVLRSMA